MRMWRGLAGAEARIESSEALDRPGEVLNSALGKVLPAGPVQDVLSGTAIGHSLHPALVAVPIGAWTSSLVLDALGQDEAATTLIAVGLAGAVPANLTGASDWLFTTGAERRVGLVHALTNYVAIGTYGLSWLARRRGRRGVGIALSITGAGLLSASGWLGGHLAYAQGVGVDTTAFLRFPEEWTPLAKAEDLPADGEISQAELDGVHLLIAARGGGFTVLADRCTHRGAPLHEGTVENGCVVCPWHGGTFDLADGSVRSGPPTRPQPVLESRLRDGSLEVRRTEERTLRNNPAGR